MEQFDGILETLRGLEGEIPSMMAETYSEIIPQIEDENLSQLGQGKRYDGSVLPDYSERSVQFFGKRPGPMTMFNHGDFWRGIKATVSTEGVEIEGTDIKTGMLELRYGSGDSKDRSLVGISDESLERLKNDYVISSMQEKVKKFATS